MNYLWDQKAYRRRTNVTTKEERNPQQGWSDKPATDSTMTAFSDLTSKLIASGTKEKIQTDTVGNRVLGIKPIHHWRFQYDRRVDRDGP